MVSSRKKKLPRLSARRAKQYAVLTAFLTLFLMASSAQAENQTITEPTDIWFEYSEPTQFTVQTAMSDNTPSDPQLWLYTEESVLLASNDDYYGLQSYLSLQLEAGRYRLRAGVCCGQPDVWRSGEGWNIQYVLISDVVVATTTSTSTTTTTTTVPETTTTVPVTTTTQPVSTTTSTEPAQVEVTSPTTTSVPPTTSTVYLPVPVVTTTTVAPTTTVAIQSTTSSSLPLVEDPSVPQIRDVVTPEDASKLATNPEVLASVSKEQAKEIFEVLNVDELSDSQLEQLVSAVQDAPTEIRKAFEESVNIFGGQVDTYVPVGSNIPVSQRRALIAITTALFAAPIVLKRK